MSHSILLQDINLYAAMQVMLRYICSSTLSTMLDLALVDYNLGIPDTSAHSNSSAPKRVSLNRLSGGILIHRHIPFQQSRALTPQCLRVTFDTFDTSVPTRKRRRK